MFSGRVPVRAPPASPQQWKYFIRPGEMTRLKGDHFKGDFHSCGDGMSIVKGKNVSGGIDLQITRKHWRGSASRQGWGRFLTFRGFAQPITAGVLRPSLKRLATLALCCQSNCSVDRNVSDNCRCDRLTFSRSENGSHICQNNNKKGNKKLEICF